MKVTILSLCRLIMFILCLGCDAFEEILRKNEAISDANGETLISPGKVFEMGFFELDINRRYVGIRYCMDRETIVWVANRDTPISSSSSSVITIQDDGNLVVKDNNSSTEYFTTNLPSSSTSSIQVLKLLDTGSAVLEDESGNQLWSSFDFPTDTFLPGMYMQFTMNLTSWNYLNDPGSGIFSFKKNGNVNGYKYYEIVASNTVYWSDRYVIDFDKNQTKIAVAAYELLSNSSQTSTYSRMVINTSGNIQLYNWDSRFTTWVLIWSEPKNNCSAYGSCGDNKSCRSAPEPICHCLPGYQYMDSSAPGALEPICARNLLSCNETRNFMGMEIMKIDVSSATFFEAGSETQCNVKCLESDCCEACVYNIGVGDPGTGVIGDRQGCWIWKYGSPLIDVEVSDGVTTGVKLFLRNTIPRDPPLNGSAKGSKSTSSLFVILFPSAISAIVLLCCIGTICYRRRINIKKRQGVEESDSIDQLYEGVRQVQDPLDPFNETGSETISIPFIDFEKILSSTDGFSNANKLGEGGFGPVYKGIFPGGLEIAVKRLSIHSGQGLEEFKNEVTLIAKLQHRNLVRLLGYCMKGNEKMLIYEYMPNKSLDAFIFDGTQSALLDWPKRFNIIMGICRGLIYLHQDSRLRIIHRDLKTSNILLDQDLNPKISDFGLAKIVNDTEMESNTQRVIGTYGYMAPEYALEGLFSVKSDVYSFGVVVLEIVSGKKKHYQCEEIVSLLNYAWHLWKRGRPLDLMEQVLTESYDHDEVLKCIIIGLLCVQEDPINRPNMSVVITMLTSDITTLPEPKKPAFLVRRLNLPSSSNHQPDTETDANLTTSTIQGR